ncbi:hypothetical protein K450DRAFT_228514 [Umbelopsis ramanniana AG]|uniref:Uncharacterized protein n=1 Tax=Umbelopsis ramanniana AG TaxID=1314678 RepID=A0AAD5EF80_UMBRA|nr:uncharacterized protein K450DRAFT_228514 [Umbelopsis ramanniana AG]KAI8582337.1 hypothetical protein K450DRAFT_228514 [Umbelopsis ramanniana AG]
MNKFLVLVGNLSQYWDNLSAHSFAQVLRLRGPHGTLQDRPWIRSKLSICYIFLISMMFIGLPFD